MAFSEVTSVLAIFGLAYPVGVLTPGDGNGDRVVNFADVRTVLANLVRPANDTPDRRPKA